MIDLTTPLGKRAAEHLQTDPVIWLTTLDADGTPQPAPVWFLWDGATLLVYSQPTARRLKNIERSPKVSVHFNTDAEADEVVVLTCEARLDPSTPPGDKVEAYLAKYLQGITRLGWTPASFAADYSVPFRITPLRLRGHLE